MGEYEVKEATKDISKYDNSPWQGPVRLLGELGLIAIIWSDGTGKVPQILVLAGGTSWHIPPL